MLCVFVRWLYMWLNVTIILLCVPLVLHHRRHLCLSWSHSNWLFCLVCEVAWNIQKKKKFILLSCGSICFQNVWEFSLNFTSKHYSFCTTIYFKWLLWITLWIPLNIVISNLTLQSLCTTLKKYITRAYEGCFVNTFKSMLKMLISSKC